MNAETIGCFIFLALIKNFSCNRIPSFKLVDNHLTAKEGSCTEIKCEVTRHLNYDGAYWFWMKNAQWFENEKDFHGTIVYSTDNSKRSVSPEYADRVKYIGSLSLSYHSSSPKPQCSILICNLNKTDSGNYSIRFVQQNNVWKTTPEVNLTVTENPCLITFEKPPVVKESDTITLTCSTLSSCPSNPQIEYLTPLPQAQLSKPQRRDEKQKSTTVSFTADWQDDGKEFSCQTKDNKDSYLIWNISVTVDYAPRGTSAKISSTNIKEGELVTLTCSAGGRPDPTFAWFKKNELMFSGAEWKIQSITDSQSGEYYCQAENQHAAIKSNLVVINVTYVPQVEVEMTPLASVVTQGDEVTLTCNLKKSNPQPHTYFWLKNGMNIGPQTNRYVKIVEPDDDGSYTCSATNTAGTGTSEPHSVMVQYGPRKTHITISRQDTEVDVNNTLTFHCDTDAKPAPQEYSWFRYSKNKQIDFSQWKPKKVFGNSLTLESVQRADEACYICNATNSISTGDNSMPKCIQVSYPPTNLTLSMDTEVTEGQHITISCTVDSFPLSYLSVTRTSKPNSRASELHFKESNTFRDHNSLQHSFNVNSTHAGFYTCIGKNSKGSVTSTKRQLVVKYRPKDVTVQAKPDFVVNENTFLTLRCDAQAHPAVTSVTWTKITDGKSKVIHQTQISLSVSPSDSGLYGCAATNEIGTGNSQQAEVKVKYAPKHTKITRAAEEQQPGSMSSVILSCSSHCYPPVAEYSWYRKAEEGTTIVSSLQNYTVYSNRPGIYYCVAKNEINERVSDPVELFVDRGFMRALKFLFLFLIILLVIFLLCFVYRHKRKKSIQQGARNIPPCSGSLGWSDCARRRNLINEPVMAEPFRSRDDLLPDQLGHPNAIRCHPLPDSTPASNMNNAYCTVNQPAGRQGPSAQKPVRQQSEHTPDVSLNYASLYFGNKQKDQQADKNIVYAVVSKGKPPKKMEPEKLDDYENVSAANAAKSPDPLDYDTDTSEEEMEVSYSQVSFKAKPGHQRACIDSSTSDEEEIQYSQVKI